MKLGVLWKSNKENEKRYPVYWEHLNNLTKKEISNLFFEDGYPDLNKLSFFKDINFLSRKKIFDTCDLVILPKPTDFDLSLTKNNQILWGWPHAVQGYNITDVAIKKKLTILAWENMFLWKDNVRKEHIFLRNNEMAGYAAVNHFMELMGVTPGVYGKELKIAILGYGSTAKGAINSLLGLGATDISVYSRRDRFQIIDAIKNVKYKKYEVIEDKVIMNGRESFKELLEYDLILNCVLQNPIKPMIFLRDSDLSITNKKKYIIDISCDQEMGFDFARPTSFENPIITTDKYIYYAVDHTPTYYWNAASYEISGALMPYLKHILKNDTYYGNIVLEKAMDIENGIIKNNDILNFQNRELEYPHKKITKEN
jgi:alanine dehydrogenase